MLISCTTSGNHTTQDSEQNTCSTASHGCHGCHVRGVVSLATTYGSSYWHCTQHSTCSKANTEITKMIAALAPKKTPQKNTEHGTGTTGQHPHRNSATCCPQDPLGGSQARLHGGLDICKTPKTHHKHQTRKSQHMLLRRTRWWVVNMPALCSQHIITKHKTSLEHTFRKLKA